MPPEFALSQEAVDDTTQVVAVRGERPAGVVTKLDLLEYLAHRSPGSKEATTGCSVR